MKKIIQIIVLLMTCLATAQSYEFSIISDYNNTGDPYELTFVATPDFTNTAPNLADMQVTFAITPGNSIETNSFMPLLGTGWQINTVLTGILMQQTFGIGDATRDLWVFTLPVPTSVLTTSHTAGEGIPIFSFIVANTPTVGQIAILENNDPLATALSGIGAVVDNVLNADLNEGSATQNYYAATDTDNNSVSFAPPIEYTYNNNWSPSDPNGVSTTVNDIIIETGAAIITQHTDCNNITVKSGASLTVQAGVTLVTASGMQLESNSTSYSSLIMDGNISGTIEYRRHVNAAAGSGAVTGNNDLISPPLSGQSFGAFRMANPNLVSGTLGGNLAFLFGPFNNLTGAFEIFDASDDSSILTAGLGYRSGSTDNGTFTFTGVAENGIVNAPINDAANSSWYLIGNPYPSYIRVQDFFNTIVASDVLDDNATGLYGYDGYASDGWTIYNLATIDASTVMAPGQGFFVKAGTAGDIVFSPSMRTTATADDFIIGRNSSLTYLELMASTANNNYTTEFYFNADASMGLDPGYDAVLWGGTAPSFALYSHLVEDNTGQPLALQALGELDYNNVTIPLGVNANQGEQLTFTISENALPSTVTIYLEDQLTNTTTVLNDGDYVLTPSMDLAGAGRFFLRFEGNALNLNDTTFGSVKVYAEPTEDTIVIFGELLEEVRLKLYDIQGRMVLQKDLQAHTGKQYIDVSTLHKGIYVVELNGGTIRMSQKVILD